MSEAEMPKQEFTLETFAKMLTRMRSNGTLRETLKQLPGMAGVSEALQDVDVESDMRQLLGLIDSMTPAERREPSKLIDNGRRLRIASGSGVEPHQVRELVKQFDALAAMMREISDLEH
jgi:signal recognition particle subunit SRP54